MRRVFADAAYFIALLLPDDDLADAVDRVSERLTGVRLVTIEPVLFEFLAHTSRLGSNTRLAAVETVRRFMARDTFELVRLTPDLFARALDFYAARADKQYSLTDCMGMLICHDYDISDVLTHDRHYAQEGFTVLL